MKPKLIIQLATLSGMGAVIIGAFGAHALKAKISIEYMSAYQTAVQYHFYHTLALLILGALAWQKGRSKSVTLSAMFFCLGIILFSGSLYALALTGITRFGMITPFGGVSFIVAWFLFWRAASKNFKSTDET